jgi:hypothetical protein
MIGSSLLVRLLWMTAAVSAQADCTKEDPSPTENPYYKSFCGLNFKVGFSDKFAPYSYQVDSEDEDAERKETLRYVNAVPSYATLDNWVGLDPAIMDEIANFLGFNYTVIEVPVPGIGES